MSVAVQSSLVGPTDVARSDRSSYAISGVMRIIIRGALNSNPNIYDPRKPASAKVDAKVDERKGFKYRSLEMSEVLISKNIHPEARPSSKRGSETETSTGLRRTPYDPQERKSVTGRHVRCLLCNNLPRLASIIHCKTGLDARLTTTGFTYPYLLLYPL